MSGYSAKVRSMAFTAGGKWLATSGSEQLILWPFGSKDGPMGKQPRMVLPYDKRVVAVACHPQQEIVAAGFEDGMRDAGADRGRRRDSGEESRAARRSRRSPGAPRARSSRSGPRTARRGSSTSPDAVIERPERPCAILPTFAAFDFMTTIGLRAAGSLVTADRAEHADAAHGRARTSCRCRPAPRLLTDRRYHAAGPRGRASLPSRLRFDFSMPARSRCTRALRPRPAHCRQRGGIGAAGPAPAARHGRRSVLLIAFVLTTNTLFGRWSMPSTGCRSTSALRTGDLRGARHHGRGRGAGRARARAGAPRGRRSIRSARSG